MRKVFLSGFFLVSAFCALNAADPQPVPKKNIPSSAQPAVTQKETKQTAMTPEQFKTKMNELINQRRQVSMQIYQQRVLVIKDDPNLRILHKTILDLHAKMAKQLNANPKIVPLVDKGKEIDNDMEKLINDYQVAGKGK